MSKIVDPENMSKFDRQYLEDRGIDPDDYAASADQSDEDETEESDDEDYSTWDAKRLQAEIASRNEGRDEDSQIVPTGTGKEGRLRKGDLVSALTADDDATEGGVAEGA